MGGTGGTPSTENPIGTTGTGTPATGGTGTAPTVNGFTMPSWVTPEMASQVTTAMSVPTVSDLGFPTAAPQNVNPTAAPQGFTHVPYQPTPVSMTPIGAPAPAPGAGAAATGPAGPNPEDWVYPGDLPINMAGIGWGATPIGVAGGTGNPSGYPNTSYSGWGAVGNFGGVAGTGSEAHSADAFAVPNALPKMAAGTALSGLDAQRYNRIKRSEYDRYMQLYGVGYDKPAYDAAIANQMRQLQAQAMALGGGQAFASGG